MKQTFPRVFGALATLRSARKPIIRGLMAAPAAALLVPAFAGIGGVSASASSYSCPCSIWTSATTPAVPANGDGSANELGVKFESSVAGYVSGVSFYKGTGNDGTHVGHLWASSGKLLAGVTFTNETASGWQTAYFSTPVAIKANTVYVASYYAPQGHYADNVGYFANSATISGPLTALRNGSSGSNSVYRYGSSGFPTLSYKASNYWVDVVFSTSTTSTTSTTSSTSTTSTTSTTVAAGPSVPSGVTASASSATSVAISWNSAAGASSYEVRRSPDGSTWATIGTVTSPSYADSGLSPSSTYYYDVIATNSSGSSAPSATASATTAADTTPPSVPTGLAASAPNPTTVNLSWLASTDNVGVAGYDVYRNGTKVATTIGTTYSDAAATAGTTYSYTVSSYDAAGNQSAQSSPVSVTTPAPSSSCTGVTVASGADIQSAVNAYGTGTTFCIQGTHYIGSAIVPKAGDAFVGTPVAGYSGPENALIDGNSSATYAVNGNNIDNVTVKDLAIEHFVGSNEIPVLGEDNEGSGWDIENNYVAYNTYEGIFAGAGAVVKNNHVEYNSQLGISGYQASNAQITGNEVDHNGSSQYTTNEGGGIKLYQGSGATITGNYVHDNVGTGIWLDTDVVNATVSGNTVANNGDTQNSSYGIQIEITCNDTVSDNTITGTTNESNAIFISSSHDVNVTGNTMSGTLAGVTLWGDDTRTTQAICGAPTINNDSVTSNTETLGSGSSYTTGVYLYNGGSGSGTAPTGDVFSGNAYHAPDCGSGAHFQWYVSSNGNYAYSGWQAKAGQDSTGTCTT